MRTSGAVFVMDGQNLVGIFTERDVMVLIVGAKRDASTTLVSEVVTAAVRTIEPACDTRRCIALDVGSTSPGLALSWRMDTCMA